MQYFTEPRWPFILFADGTLAQYRQKVYQQNEEGIEGYKFLIMPSTTIINKYDIKPDEIDPESGLMVQWYPATTIFILSDDPITGKILCTQTFTGEDTRFSLQNKDWQIQLESYQKQVFILQLELERLHDDMRITSSRQEELLSNLTRIKDVMQAKPKDENDDAGEQE